jgi:hypothetical protein
MTPRPRNAGTGKPATRPARDARGGTQPSGSEPDVRDKRGGAKVSGDSRPAAGDARGEAQASDDKPTARLARDRRGTVESRGDAKAVARDKRAKVESRRESKAAARDGRGKPRSRGDGKPAAKPSQGNRGEKSSGDAKSGRRIGVAGWLMLVVLVIDTVLLATLELLFLPLRMDGTLLPNLGAIPMPLTVIVAVVTTPLVVSAAGRLVHPRVAVVPLIVWVLTVVVVGLAGPGGDTVLIPDWRAFLLLAGGALPGAMALGGALAIPSDRKRK